MYGGVMKQQQFMIYDDVVPFDEQSGLNIKDADYLRQAHELGNRTIELLKKTGTPEGVTFKVTDNPHDFGTYCMIEAFYDDADDTQTAYVLWLECMAPSTWDETPEVWDGT